MERIESFSKSDKELVAAKGIIYLMFVGRKIKAYDITKKLIETRIVSKDSVVYQYVNSLQRRGYIKKVEEKGGQGNPKIRTANLEPIFETIGVSRRLVDGLFFSTNKYSMKDEEKKDIELLFENIGGIMDFFPNYLQLRLGKEDQGFRNLKWKETLYYFLHFCIDVINACSIKRKTPGVEVEDYKKLPSVFGRTIRRIFMMAYIVEEAFQIKKLSERDLTALANLTIKGYNDVYESGTFLNSLYLMALSLTNPEAAHFVENYIKPSSKKYK